MYEKGLIYRGEYMVNWCPQCRTAISDLEVTHDDVQGQRFADLVASLADLRRESLAQAANDAGQKPSPKTASVSSVRSRRPAP